MYHIESQIVLQNTLCFLILKNKPHIVLSIAVKHISKNLNNIEQREHGSRKSSKKNFAVGQRATESSK